MCSIFISLHVIGINLTHQNIRTHHVIIIAMIIVHAMLTLCYFIMSHATLILYYHTSMLTLHTSLISPALGCHMHDIREVRVYSHRHTNVNIIFLLFYFFRFLDPMESLQSQESKHMHRSACCPVYQNANFQKKKKVTSNASIDFIFILRKH